MLMTIPPVQRQSVADALGITMAERAVDQDFIARALAVLDRDRRRAPETPAAAA